MKLCATAGAILIMMICGCSTAPSSSPNAPTTDPLTLSESVADWQLAHMTDRSIYDSKYDTLDPRGWVQGAFFIDLAKLAERSDEPRFAAALARNGEAQQWWLGERLLYADDHVIGQAYQWTYGRLHDPAIARPDPRELRRHTRESTDGLARLRKNHGILDATTYRDSIERGWAALTRAVQPDGKLGWVQRVGGLCARSSLG